MKYIKITLLALIAILSSCTAIDVRVDKSKLKTETVDYAYYPSTAVMPVVNPDEINEIIQTQVINVIISGTK